MGISIPQLIVVVIVLVMLFGTGRLRTLGEDLGAALRGFRKALGGQDQDEASPRRLPGESGAPRPTVAKRSDHGAAGPDDEPGRH